MQPGPAHPLARRINVYGRRRDKCDVNAATRCDEQEVSMGQPGWFFCMNCHGMNFAGDTNLPRDQRPGKCIAGDNFGGKHQEKSFEFELPFNPNVPPNDGHHGAENGQPNWFFCNKCACMFFPGPEEAPLQLAGVCHAGGPHDRGNTSFNFVLPHNLPGPPAPGVQPGWFFCVNCLGLVFFDKLHRSGSCPAGDMHVKQSGGTFEFFCSIMPLFSKRDDLEEMVSTFLRIVAIKSTEEQYRALKKECIETEMDRSDAPSDDDLHRLWMACLKIGFGAPS
jgi:hypothetical protein